MVAALMPEHCCSNHLSCLQVPQHLHNSLGLPMMGSGGFGGGMGGPEAQLPDDIMGGIDDGGAGMRQRGGQQPLQGGRSALRGGRGARGAQMQPPQMQQQQYGGPVGPQGGRGGRGPGRGPQPGRWVSL